MPAGKAPPITQPKNRPVPVPSSPGSMRRATSPITSAASVAPFRQIRAERLAQRRRVGLRRHGACAEAGKESRRMIEGDSQGSIARRHAGANLRRFGCGRLYGRYSCHDTIFDSGRSAGVWR